MTDSARRGQGSKGFLSWSQLFGSEAAALRSKKRRRNRGRLSGGRPLVERRAMLDEPQSNQSQRKTGR